MREWTQIERFPGSPRAGYEYRLDGDAEGFSVEVPVKRDRGELVEVD